MIIEVGARSLEAVENSGRFARFCGRAFTGTFGMFVRPSYWSLVWTQMHSIGVRSVPVVMVTGAFVGMVLAIQAYDQLAGMGLEERLGVLINISVVKELASG